MLRSWSFIVDFLTALLSVLSLIRSHTSTINHFTPLSSFDTQCVSCGVACGENPSSSNHASECILLGCSQPCPWHWPVPSAGRVASRLFLCLVFVSYCFLDCLSLPFPLTKFLLGILYCS
ncbi:hypothetical protein HDV57DRAFT_271172 [Trichoderma longibrachiatum]